MTPDHVYEEGDMLDEFDETAKVGADSADALANQMEENMVKLCRKLS